MARQTAQSTGNDKFEMNLNGFKAAEWPLLQELINKLDMQGIGEILSRVITKWPYESDPSQVQSWLDLGFADWIEVQTEFLWRFRPLAKALAAASELSGSR